MYIVGEFCVLALDLFQVVGVAMIEVIELEGPLENSITVCISGFRENYDGGVFGDGYVRIVCHFW